MRSGECEEFIERAKIGDTGRRLYALDCPDWRRGCPRCTEYDRCDRCHTKICGYVAVPTDEELPCPDCADAVGHWPEEAARLMVEAEAESDARLAMKEG